MRWNWQEPEWPHFTWDASRLAPLEEKLLYESGVQLGAFKHLDKANQNRLTIELVSNEALKTSEIEGEYLDRDSLQSSICRQFGLEADNHKIKPAEQGIAEMMVDLYHSFAEPLTEASLFSWHRSLMQGRQDLKATGCYRSHPEPMQVVSGYIHQPKVHFEAPPSAQVAAEMAQFIKWFNNSAPSGKSPLPLLTRAGMTHLYFVCIHPFEDGNGRIGRALAEKALAQGLGYPSLIALSQTIESQKKAYYSALAHANHTLAITDWLIYFASTRLEAGQATQTWVEFLSAKTKLYARLADSLNPRQEKVLARMFKEGPKGFKGGLSAENYISITDAPRATVSRDLQDLVEKGALTRTGERRHTRYWLNLQPEQPCLEDGFGRLG